MQTEVQKDNTLMYMDLDEIIPNPLNKWNAQKLDDLESSILFNGLITPVSVIGPNSDGKYVLIAGERRWRIFNKLCEEGKEGYDKLPAYVIGSSTIGITRQELMIEASNLDTREDESDKQAHYLNVVRLMKKIREEEGLTLREYVEMRTKYMKCSERYARFYEQVFYSENEELQDMVANGELSVSRAGRIAKMPDHIQKEAISDLKSGMNQDQVVSKHAEKAKNEKRAKKENLPRIDDVQEDDQKDNCTESSFETAIDFSGNNRLDDINDLDELEEFDFSSVNTDFLSCDSTNALGQLKSRSGISTADELETVLKWCNKLMKEHAPSEEEWEAIEACRKLAEKFS